MIDTVERAHLSVERYMRRAGRTERQKQAAAEHWQIFQAIERKAYDRASTLLQEHILHAGEEIRRDREQWRQRPLAKQPDKARARAMGKRQMSASSLLWDDFFRAAFAGMTTDCAASRVLKSTTRRPM
jgi:FCD domain